MADIWHRDGFTLKDPEQRILEADPPRRLSYMWSKMTPEWSRRSDPDFVAKMEKEPRSKVTFELDPVGDAVKLTVIHDDLEQGSLTLENISGGWPQVLSNLKTLLETGSVLADLTVAAKRHPDTHERPCWGLTKDCGLDVMPQRNGSERRPVGA